MNKLFIIVLASLSMLGAYGQNTMSFSDMEGKWNEWLLQLREPYTLHSNHFKDTVSLQEMKEAFTGTRTTRTGTHSLETGIP